MRRLRHVLPLYLSAPVVLGLLLSMPVAQANEDTLYNVFSLSSEASAEVDNDLMVATLVVQAEDKDPALLASKINASMSWAVNVLRPYGALKTKTRDYQTYPRYDTGKNRKLIGWRGNQSIQIETDDFEAAGKAIQKLQERLQVQGIQLAAKAETRTAAADALMNDALSAFKKRASLIQRNMGASGYRILDVNIQTDQGHAAMYDSRSSRMETMSSSRVAEPSIEAGTSRVSVQVYGRVQLD
jgi:predicted secreted protein